MSNLVKTVQTELIPITEVLKDTNVKSSVFNVATMFAGSILWDWAAYETTATPAQTELAVQTSQKDTGDDTWVTMFTWLSSAAAAAARTVSAGGGIGATTITLNASISTTANVYFFLKNATVAHSEWPRRIGETGGFMVTVEDGFTYDQSAAAGWTLADRYKFDIDFTSIRRLRVAINNNRSAASNRHTVNRVALITADSIV